MDALDQIQVKKSKFYNQRYIVELSLADREEYEQLLTRYFVDAQQAPQRLGQRGVRAAAYTVLCWRSTSSTATRWTREESQSCFPSTDWSFAWLNRSIVMYTCQTNDLCYELKNTFESKNPFNFVSTLRFHFFHCLPFHFVVSILCFHFLFPLSVSTSMLTFCLFSLPFSLPFPFPLPPPFPFPFPLFACRRSSSPPKFVYLLQV